MTMENLENSEKIVSVASEQNRFLAKVYGWMTLALALSAAVAFFTVRSQFLSNLIFGNGFGYLILAIAEIVVVIWLSAKINKISAKAATVAFILYSILNGMTLSSIFLVYNIKSIATVFVISAAMFLVMAIYGTFSKANILSFGRFFFMAITGLVIASLLNLFLKSERLDWIISIVGVVVFTGCTAYDAKKMLVVSQRAQNTEVFNKASIIGALELYLDFVNIFLYLLRLFGRKRR